MTPDEALDQTRAFINEIGEDIAIRRFTGTGTPRPYTDTTTKARVTGFQPSQLVGPIVQGDRKVVALVDTLTSLLPITTNDKVVVGGRQLAIKAVDDNTRRIGGTLVALEMVVAGGLGAIGSAAYTAKAVHFDGAAFLSNNAFVCTDNSFFSYAMWSRVNPNDIVAQGTNVTIWAVDPQNVYGGAAWISQDPYTKFDVCNSSGLTYAQALGGTLVTDVWLATMGSVDVSSNGASNLVQSYLGDIAQTILNPNANAGTVIGTNGLPFWVGNDGVDSVPFDLSNLLIWPGTFIDWSVEANRRKFIDVSGKAVDPAQAISAFGNPAVYMTGDASTFATNQGTGGTFTLTGALTNASTSPSD